MRPFSRSMLTGALSAAVVLSTVGVAQASPSAEAVEPPSATADATVDDVVGALAEAGGLSESAASKVADLIDRPVETFDGLSLAEGTLAAILPDAIDPRVEMPIGDGSVLLDIVDATLSADATDGIARLESGNDLFTVHATDLGVQIVNIATTPVDEHSFAIDTTLPEGTAWESRSDGGLDLVDESGALLGEIATPWSVDNVGKRLPTYFEVDGDRVVQRVDTRNAAFPVVSDPKVSAWTKAKCIGSIALLAGGAYVKLASIAMKLKNMATWNRGFSVAYRNAVGSTKFSVGELKYLLGMMKKYAQGRLSKVDDQKIARLLREGGAATLAIAGLDDCGRWWGWIK